MVERGTGREIGKGQEGSSNITVVGYRIPSDQ